LLAQVSAQLEFYQDAAATYDRYLKLKPADEVARRNAVFVLARDGQYQRALPDLERYVHSTLVTPWVSTSWPLQQAYVDHGKAIESLDHALTLDAVLTQARYTRAVLKIDDGNPRQPSVTYRTCSTGIPQLSRLCPPRASLSGRWTGPVTPLVY